MLELSCENATVGKNGLRRLGGVLVEEGREWWKWIGENKQINFDQFLFKET